MCPLFIEISSSLRPLQIISLSRGVAVAIKSAGAVAGGSGGVPVLIAHGLECSLSDVGGDFIFRVRASLSSLYPALNYIS